MSLAAMQWAWQQALPATQKLVLVAMADHANKEEGVCWPSLEHLAKKTGLCTRTIKTARRQLREKELIITLRPGRYRLCHPLQKVSVQKGSACPSEVICPCECCARHREAVALTSGDSLTPFHKNPKNNPKRNFGNPSGCLSIKESHFLQTWHRHEKNGFRELADTRKTNPAEARKTMISLMRNLTPRIVPMVLGEEE